MRFSPDGKALAAATQSDIIHLWDVGTLKERCRMAGRWLLVFSANGRLLAAPHEDAGICLWDSDNGKKVYYIPRPDKNTLSLYPLCFSSDGRMLVGWANPDGRRARKAVWWCGKWRQGGNGFAFTPKGMKSSRPPFPDGRHWLSAGRSEPFHIWDVRTGVERPCLCGDQGEVRGPLNFEGRPMARQRRRRYDHPSLARDRPARAGTRSQGIVCQGTASQVDRFSRPRCRPCFQGHAGIARNSRVKRGVLPRTSAARDRTRRRRGPAVARRSGQRRLRRPRASDKGAGRTR